MSSYVALHNPKNQVNLGSSIRACSAYGSKGFFFSGRRIKGVTKLAADTSNGWRDFPVIHTENIFNSIPVGATPIAVDLIDNAIDIRDFKHPDNAIYIFGAEDATLGKKITSRCKETIFVPTKHCMNLAATVNVVLYDRMIKRNIRS